ncbi:hypothetical protein C8R43DRAFT_948972 [Mycena crocata]|nr:hypothetical protein C8R43DRAFT_948972 [Mycena crocata]
MLWGCNQSASFVHTTHSTPTTMMIHLYVVLYEGFDAEHLRFLDFFEPLGGLEIKYVSLDGKDVGTYAIQLSLQDLARQDRRPFPSQDVVFIPGATDLDVKFSKSFFENLTPIVVGGPAPGSPWLAGFRDIIAVDTSILTVVKIRTDVMMQIQSQMRECVFAIPESKPELGTVPLHVTQPGTWSVSSGSSENLKTLAILLRNTLRNDGQGQRFGRYPPLVPITSGDVAIFNRSEVARKELQDEGKLDDHTFHIIYSTAARLVAQGFLAAGTSVFQALISDYPACVAGRHEIVRWPFEFFWDAAGNRPSLPWEAPSEQKLVGMYLDQREDYPPTMSDKMEALGVIDVKFRSGYKRIVIDGHPSEWADLLKCRPLAPIILEGELGKVTGQTAEGAEVDAERIISAFRSWPSTQEPRRKAREAERSRFASLDTPALLDILEPFKSDDDVSLRTSPAAERDIAEVESRLCLSLPKDYRDFLLVSNGMKFMPSLELPGLRLVEGLVWEEANDLGLEELEVTLGMKTDDHERTLLPKMGRVLMISASDDEEQVWLLQFGALAGRPSSTNSQREPRTDTAESTGRVESCVVEKLVSRDRVVSVFQGLFGGRRKKGTNPEVLNSYILVSNDLHATSYLASFIREL